jgi:hypothetical protein
MHAGCNFTKEIKKDKYHATASDKTQQSLQLHPPQMTNVWKDNAEGKDKNFHFGQKCFQTPQKCLQQKRHYYHNCQAKQIKIRPGLDEPVHGEPHSTWS